MPTPSLTLNSPVMVELQEIIDSLPDHLKTTEGVRQEYERRGQTVSRATLHSRREKLRILQAEDPGLAAARMAAGAQMQPAMAWIKTQTPDEDGKTYSVMLKAPNETQAFADMVAERFEAIPSAPKVPPPRKVDGDLLNLLPIFDFHLGMLAWAQETGEAYDTNLAADRLKRGAADLLALAPKADTAIILNGGDFTHANDQTNVTPTSKHGLDVDGRHWRTMEMAIEVTAAVIEMTLATHRRVFYRALPGNHDPSTALMLSLALKQRYRGNDRVEIIAEPSEFFAHQHGETMIAAHHGDKAKGERLILGMADACREMWGSTLHRYYWTGHKHHHKSQEFAGCYWEQLPSVAPKDAYATSHAYASRAALPLITYHAKFGEVMRHRRPFMLDQ